MLRGHHPLLNLQLCAAGKSINLFKRNINHLSSLAQYSAWMGEDEALSVTYLYRKAKQCYNNISVAVADILVEDGIEAAVATAATTHTHTNEMKYCCCPRNSKSMLLMEPAFSLYNL